MLDCFSISKHIVLLILSHSLSLFRQLCCIFSFLIASCHIQIFKSNNHSAESQYFYLYTISWSNLLYCCKISAFLYCCFTAIPKCFFVQLFEIFSSIYLALLWLWKQIVLYFCEFAIQFGTHVSACLHVYSLIQPDIFRQAF